MNKLKVQYEEPIHLPWNQEEVETRLRGMVYSLVEGLKNSIYSPGSYGKIGGKGYLFYKETFHFLKNKNRTPWPHDVEVELDYSNFLKFKIFIDSGPKELEYWEDSVSPEICFPDPSQSLEEAMKNKEFADALIELVEKVFAPEFLSWTLTCLKMAYLHSGEVPKK